MRTQNKREGFKNDEAKSWPIRSNEFIRIELPFCACNNVRRSLDSVKMVHSKNSRVRFDPEKSARGQTHFGVRPTRNPGQTYPESRSDLPGIQVRLTRNPSQKDNLDSDSGNFYPDSRSVWPRNGSGPMGPFSGSNLTREFLECTGKEQQHHAARMWQRYSITWRV